jgi:SAM-dependent methyltransferase
MDLYQDPELYDAAHWWKTNDLEFITGWADRLGGPVLELAAGTGRLALPILERGHTYVGLDSSPAYVAWARRKLDRFGERATLIHGDMRDFALDRQFRFIFIGFNSLLHLLTNDDVAACFQCVRRHLDDEGKFFIDVFVPHPEFLYRDPERLYRVMDFEHPRGGQCVVKERNRYDPETQINHIQWFFYREGQSDPERYQFDMHMLYPDTLDRLLTEAGFAIEAKWGDYDGTPLNEESPLQIYLCRRC